MFMSHLSVYISVSTRVDQHRSTIAFHAELGRNQFNLTVGQTIKFETVKENFGNAYDPKLGVFTCPKSGIYFFAFTIMSNAGKVTQTKLGNIHLT